MKNPKWKCANDTGTHKVKFGGKFLTQWDGYHLTLEQSTGGTISADKLKGYQEQSANLSYTADTFYHFNGWNSTGANIQNNQVPFTADTTAKANFVYDPIPQSGRTTFTHYGRTMTWMNHDLNYDDGGSGIMRIDEPFIIYKKYTEGGDPVNTRINLPGPICYYTLGAAYRVAEKISGWHMPVEEDWDYYTGPKDQFKQGWYETRTQSVLKYWPAGDGYYGSTQTWESNFNALPVADYETMSAIMNGNKTVVSGSTIGTSYNYINMMPRWWCGSAGINYQIPSYVGLDGIWYTRYATNNTDLLLPVRLVKD